MSEKSPTTKSAIETAAAQGRAEVQTADGRTWEIERADGGFLLFEIDNGPRFPREHAAHESDTWTKDDLIDYLGAFGSD